VSALRGQRAVVGSLLSNLLSLDGLDPTLGAGEIDGPLLAREEDVEEEEDDDGEKVELIRREEEARITHVERQLRLLLAMTGPMLLAQLLPSWEAAFPGLRIGQAFMLAAF
jgi:hypothetical protein